MTREQLEHCSTLITRHSVEIIDLKCIDRTGNLHHVSLPVTDGILHSKILLCDSNDEGATWSDWRELPTPGLAGCSTTGPMVLWPDRTLACAFESFKEFDDPRPGRHAAWLVVVQGRRSHVL